ncbi:RNA polymerase sigma-70 factor [Flavobacterium sp. F-380]|uniref:RNA polymerase sigma-70 factor n=1 Tax=Flavobacterium kayseriense TaxID=2764714 RepID=A0ABR7J898_9FLAO|nr:RNA polymerase sigma-70 factor [Flavobacterium kayseriense]MBC5841628.1 RNA polymerase sigma-70 factor [Flavobacterium kayseriense]MBC5848156.1 RNA polymerase sigma-70 factor [Flavobacterium kayseriense]MBU0942328.1 RNA polymerase sigma-70 factor [Bacteroidota bacterium]
MSHDKQSLCEQVNFNEIYLKNVQAATNFAYYKCGDRDAALDIVQDAFAKIWEHCSQIDYHKVKTYLFTTVNNLFLNTIKHQKVVLAYAKDTPNLDRTNQSPEYILEEEEFKVKLQNAIASLSEAQREVFLMNRIDGKKYREIAELLDISQKAVEKRMSGALKLLKAQIENI